MASAGSPGSSCCSPKMITDTNNSVGISCRRRLPSNRSILGGPQNLPSKVLWVPRQRQRHDGCHLWIEPQRIVFGEGPAPLLPSSGTVQVAVELGLQKHLGKGPDARTAAVVLAGVIADGLVEEDGIASSV